jgi:hypothetical protein
MSTTIVESWATDISALGPVYPFVGSEVLLWILGLAFWIGFHLLQGRLESRQVAEEEATLKDKAKMAEVMKRYDRYEILD